MGLKELRTQLDLTVEDVASATGLSYRTIMNAEEGKKVSRTTREKVNAWMKKNAKKVTA